MAKQIQLRRGTTAENSAFTGAVGEVSVDTDKDVLVVHDGVTGGGFPNAARANTDGTISLIKKDGTVITTIPATGLFNNTLTSTATDQALTAAQGKVLNDQAFGIGQTLKDVTASRALGITYTNPSDKTILIYVLSTQISNTSLNFKLTVGAFVMQTPTNSTGAAAQASITFYPIPPKTTYMVENGDSGGTAVLLRWVEYS